MTLKSVLPKIGGDNILRGAPKSVDINNSLGEVVIERLKTHGSAVLLVDAANGVEITAEKILLDVVTIAEKLRARGVQPGDVVGFCSENRLEYPAPVVATLAIGAICAPLNPLYTNSELIHTMSISQPSIVFCSPFTAAKLVEVKPSLPFLKTLIVFGDVESDGNFTAYNDLLKSPGNPATFKPTKVDVNKDVAVCLCSSGTTGLPKCVELTHFNLLIFIDGLSDTRIAGDINNETILGLIPFFHGYGYAVMLSSIVMKIKIAVMSMFDEKLFLKTIQDYKISLLFLVPPLLVFLAKHPMVDEYDLSCVKQIRCGAAPLSKETQLAVQKRLKLKNIKQGYGMTELSVACVFVPEGMNKIGSSGIVTPGMECKVVDIQTGKALPAFKEGELCFKGPYVMKGYRNNKKATDETIDKDGWLHTGDIGFYDLQGFLYIVDRLKELIKYKGFQVAPAELEALLLQNSAVKDAAVIGIPDEDAGELPFAFIVKQPGAKISAGQIQKFVAGKVSAQKRLSGGVRFVEEIPKNPSGKIMRRELRNLYKSTSTKAKL